jgi:hypothetical protein
VAATASAENLVPDLTAGTPESRAIRALLLRLDPAQRIGWVEDRGVLEGVEIEQILVAGDDQLDLGGERQGEDVVIVGIATDRLWEGLGYENFSERLDLRPEIRCRTLTYDLRTALAAESDGSQVPDLSYWTFAE